MGVAAQSADLLAESANEKGEQAELAGLAAELVAVLLAVLLATSTCPP